MTQTTDPQSLPSRRRWRWDAIAQLVLAAGSAGLLVAISYGFNLEYADTSASDAGVAARSFVDWWIGFVVVAAFALGAIAAARRSPGARTMCLSALVVTAGSVIGVPAGAVLGMHEKLDRYPDQPSCTSGFRSGPAVPVLRAAQDEFVELDHPGPFSGGGASGVDGCAVQLMVGREVDVPAAYRSTLAGNGWRIAPRQGRTVSATKANQAFEAYREDGYWWVWIGPRGGRPSTQPGQGVHGGAPAGG